MKYLIDSLQRYETGHGDALSPTPRDAEKSFMGEHNLVRAVTVNDFHVFSTSVLAALNSRGSPCAGGHGRSSPSSPCSAPLVSLLPTDTPVPTGTFNLPTQHPTVVSPPHNSHTQLIPASTHSEAPIPTAGVLITDLGRQRGAWRRALTQWKEPDPISKLPALQDWPEEWYTGPQKCVTASKRSIRMRISMEYDR